MLLEAMEAYAALKEEVKQVAVLEAEVAAHKAYIEKVVKYQQDLKELAELIKATDSYVYVDNDSRPRVMEILNEYR